MRRALEVFEKVRHECYLMSYGAQVEVVRELVKEREFQELAEFLEELQLANGPAHRLVADFLPSIVLNGKYAQFWRYAGKVAAWQEANPNWSARLQGIASFAPRFLPAEMEQIDCAINGHIRL